MIAGLLDPQVAEIINVVTMTLSMISVVIHLTLSLPTITIGITIEIMAVLTVPVTLTGTFLNINMIL